MPKTPTNIACNALIVLSAANIIAQVCLEERKKGKNKKRRGPDRPWIKRREELGARNTLIEELRLEDVHSYRNYLRMDENSFVFLLSLIEGDIKKHDTVMRNAIKPDERLAITLKFYATGMTYRELSYVFRVGERTVSNIVREVTSAIVKNLKFTFKWPENQNDWKEIANGFSSRCNLPNCVGAVDGKHIVMRKPNNSGSHYHNYKGTESIVLLAIVDSNLVFRYIDVGVNGRISDGGVWDRCRISHLLNQNKLQLSCNEVLPGSSITTAQYFVADAAFPLSQHLMKPYPDRSLTAPQAIFNYRLSRARRCVECAFGVLASRFRLFQTNINLQPPLVKNLVIATCSLHNYLISRTSTYASNDQDTVISPSQIMNLPPSSSRNATSLAKEMRSKLTHYFLTEAGRVEWQYRAAGLS